MPRPLDLILFGATGFTGGLTAEYLARHAPETLRWAIAGRDVRKLEAVRARLAAIDARWAELPTLTIDLEDAAALERTVATARAVATTIGPYLRHGEPLVAACARTGTHYADITGEPEFVDRMWLEQHDTAVASGAKLVHCCGFDSVPHDLGTWFTVQQLPEGVPLVIEGFVRAGGRLSGGTFHSAVNAFARPRQMAQASRDRRAREAGPAAARRIGSTRLRLRTARGRGWAVPFPSIDPQIVRRSAAALARYGPDFRYGHYLVVPGLVHVAGLAGGAGAVVALAQAGPTRRWLLSKKPPGDGPTPAQREEGWFRVRFVGEGGGARVVTEVRGGDPGYDETAKMLAHSALALALDPLPAGGGQQTPTQAMGDVLLARLRGAGIEFTVIEPA